MLNMEIKQNSKNKNCVLFSQSIHCSTDNIIPPNITELEEKVYVTK